jgi:CTP:molybdopterin cytidylyltransferase MocA
MILAGGVPCSTHATIGVSQSTRLGLETVGVPALFSDRYFCELLRLNSDRGARQIIQQHLPETYTLAFPNGSIDLDTPDQYRAFLDNRAVGQAIRIPDHQNGIKANLDA